MKKLPQIRRIQRKLEFEGAIINVYSDYMEMPDHKQERWDFVEHKKGAAAVVPILPDGKILLVRQYRNALERETIELPAGARNDAKEDPALCAARELEEETGYRPAKLEHLLSLQSTVAFCNESIEVFLAEELEAGEQKLDEHEYIQLESYSLEELCQMIYEGKIQDSKTVAGILAYGNRKKNH